MIIEIVTDAGTVSARYAAAAEEAPGAMAARFATAVIPLADAGKSILVDVTPKVTGALADSTVYSTEIGELEAQIDYDQPATSADGVEYGIIVRQGRGPVVPLRPAFALAGPNFGPVAYAGPAAANDYAQEALDQMQVGMRGAMDAMAHDLADSVVRLLA